MRKSLLALALVAGLGVSACSTTGGVNPADVQNVINLVQQDTQAVCKYVPTVATVAAIITSFIPGGAAIEQIAAQVAEQICSSVTAQAAVPGRVPHVVVNGKRFEVHGHFVN